MSKEVVGFLTKANLPNQAQSQPTQQQKSGGFGDGAFSQAHTKISNNRSNSLVAKVIRKQWKILPIKAGNREP